MSFSPPADLFGEQGIIVLVVIAVVLFGSTQIPKLARSLGSAQKEFKKGLDEGAQDDRRGSGCRGRSAGPGPSRRTGAGTCPGHPRPAPPAADGSADAAS